MLATYAAPVRAHPTRTGLHRSTRPRLLIIHTSEGGELPTSAEALARFISTPRTESNLASYHYIADTDQVIPVVPDDYVAYANAGANNDGLSICYPGKAGQTTEQWGDANSSAMHEQVARWLADKSAEYGIPLRKLLVSQVQDGTTRGVCGHLEVSLAFKRSTHTDPGPYFPWASVMNRAIQLSAPPIPPDSGDDDDVALRKVLCRLQDRRMICTDLYSYANYCTEEEGARLRDQEGAEVVPDGVQGGTGPWPVYDNAQNSYLTRLADR